MAKKISQLTQATQVKSDDVTVIVQDGETKKLPLNMMVTKQDIENKKVAGLAKLDEIEATYENDTYTPTIAVKNKSSVKVGEGDGVDYSANVMDGHVKSAILKGQTLKNIIDYRISVNSNTTIGADGTITINANGKYTEVFLPALEKLPSTKYWVGINVIENTLNGDFNICAPTGNNCIFNYFFSIVQGFVGVKEQVLTTMTDLSSAIYTFRSYLSSAVSEGVIKYKVMVIPYQEGMENWNIPYFTGMQSVKMPVLTTTGKNLCPNIFIESNKGRIHERNGGIIKDGSLKPSVYVSEYINIKGLDYITYNRQSGLNKDGTDGVQSYAFYDDNKKYISGAYNKTTLTVPSDAYYFRISIDSEQDFQLEEGKQATSYEPYKSNILTVNEEVELHGVGDVKDELNLLTGEVVKNISEVILNGSETWIKHSAYTTDEMDVYWTQNDFIPSNSRATEILCDKLSVASPTVLNSIRTNGNGGIFIGLPSGTKIESYLQSNPIKVRYKLKNPTIKTVDLMPSGTHPSTTPYCWKDGHIQLSSSGLLPSLEYSVVTSRAGQISQNAAMIVKNDKRIFDLEILLAGGLVNTTYQALTLQNQVETGLSKVSLSSEKEPDYLLYHMIMKLIEEKAYKLDDLAEKVSVFYLYEKLSDEQFETIYAALYPFAEDEYFESDIPGDDEVIEEPIVDESLEEVEDEVVM